MRYSLFSIENDPLVAAAENVDREVHAITGREANVIPYPSSLLFHPAPV
jgi:hypothetical protein